MTPCARSAVCSSIPRARARSPTWSTSTGSHYDEMPQLARTLKVRAVTDTLAQRAGPALPRNRGRDRSHPSGTGRRDRGACSADTACTARITGTWRRCWPSRWPKPSAARPDLAEPLAIVVGGGRRWRRGGCPPSAVVRCGDGEVDGGLPLLPRPAAGVAERGRRRARPLRGEPRRVPSADGGARRLVAAGHDGVDHTRHQTRRGCAGQDRCAVAGAVAVGRVRRRRGSNDASHRRTR